MDEALITLFLQLVAQDGPIIVLGVYAVVTIIKSATKHCDAKVKMIIKDLLPLISTISGALLMLVFASIRGDATIAERLAYGAIIGLMTSGLYDNIKSLIKRIGRGGGNAT